MRPRRDIYGVIHRSPVRIVGGGSGNTNGDDGGELTNGIFGGSYALPHDTVAFNEYHGTNAGTDTGDPQPRIDLERI